MTGRRVHGQALAVLALVPLLLTGCTETTDLGDPKVVGAVTEFGDPIAVEPFDGPTADGGTFDSAAYRGRVLVVNTWYAGCDPCRREAPDLVALDEQFGDEVQFVGVNTRDTAGTALGFEKDYSVEYPTVLDAASGDVQLTLGRSKAVAPNATPTTLVLDREGRVTARILGQIPERNILETLIESALEGERAS